MMLVSLWLNLALGAPPQTGDHPPAHHRAHGLQASHVTALTTWNDTLFVGTLGGGLHRWDGKRLQYMSGGPTFIRTLAPDGDGLLIAGIDGLMRWDGKRFTSLVEGPVDDVMSVNGQVYWLSDGVLHTSQRTWPLDCTALWTLTAGERVDHVVTCDRMYRLEEAPSRELQPLHALPHHLQATAAIERRAGFWTLEPGGLRNLEQGMEVDSWQPPAGDSASQMSRFGDGLLVVTEAGALHELTPDGPAELSPAMGLPGATATTVAAAPARKAWVGTTAGLALLTPDHHALSFPVAPDAATPAHWVLPAHHGRGAAVLGERGVRWVGRGEPCGWRAFASASGAAITMLQTHDRSWWSVGPHGALQLDTRGRLHHWDTLDGTFAAVPYGPGLVLLGEHGHRAWLPGATQLGPLVPAPAGDLLTGDRAGGLWWSLNNQVILGRDPRDPIATWTLEDAVMDIAIGDTSVWAQHAHGVVQLDLDTGEVEALNSPGTPDLIVHGATSPTWLTTESELVSRAGVWSLPGPFDRLVLHHAHLNGHHLWLATEAGVYRVDVRKLESAVAGPSDGS